MLGIRRNSLSYKTAILYIILTVLLVSVFNFIIWENQSELILRSHKLTSEIQSVRLKQILARRLSAMPPGSAASPEAAVEYAAIAEASLKEGALGIALFTETGRLLFRKGESAPADTVAEKLMVNRSIAKFELEDKDFHHEMDLPNGVVHLYVPQPLGAGGEMVVARFPMALGSLEEDKNVLLRLCLLVTGLVVLLQIIFAYFLRKIVIVPVSKLEKMTHEVARGNFNQTIDINQDDEVGHLASAFNEMIMNLVRIREEAKGANPLTGLPGNNVIISKMDELIGSKSKFAVIYGDLDNFKAYNDKYGFTKGDDVILYTRDCLVEAATKFGDESTFVGHEGGDDFVIMTAFDNWEPICKGIISGFDSGIKQFYTEADASQGFIDSVDRQGKRVRFPLISISIAVASNNHRPIEDHRLLVSIAAEMKKFVKKTEGSNYAIDKRVN